MTTEAEFDWTPETLHLSDAAAWIVVCHQSIDKAPTNYRASMNVWERLTGMDEAEALTFAYQIAGAVPAVTAIVPPF